MPAGPSTHTIHVSSQQRCQMIDISDEVAEACKVLAIHSGALTVASLHTTGAVTVNEGHDPDVQTDLLSALERMVPADGYLHGEGNSDAHVKVSLLGAAQVVPVVDAQPVLGRWQRIFFCEFDGPRDRQVLVTPMR